MSIVKAEFKKDREKLKVQCYEWMEFHSTMP